MRSVVFAVALSALAGCVSAPEQFAPGDAGGPDARQYSPLEWVQCGQGRILQNNQLLLELALAPVSNDSLVLTTTDRNKVCAMRGFSSATGDIEPACVVDPDVDFRWLASVGDRAYMFGQQCDSSTQNLAYYQVSELGEPSKTCVDWTFPVGFAPTSLTAGNFKEDEFSVAELQGVAATTDGADFRVDAEVSGNVVVLNKELELSASGQGDSDCLIATTPDGFLLCQDLAECTEITCDDPWCEADSFAFSDGSNGSMNVAARSASGAVEVTPVDSLERSAESMQVVDGDAIWMGWASWASCKGGALASGVMEEDNDLVVVRTNGDGSYIVSVHVDALSGERNPSVCDQQLVIAEGDDDLVATVVGTQLWLVARGSANYWRFALHGEGRCGD